MATELIDESWYFRWIRRFLPPEPARRYRSVADSEVNGTTMRRRGGPAALQSGTWSVPLLSSGVGVCPVAGYRRPNLREGEHYLCNDES